MATRRKKHGEDYLDTIQAIELTLENGKTVKFNMGDELAIPDGHVEILSEVRKAPARLSFWVYQAERILSKLRSAERRLAEKIGYMDTIYRQWYAERGEEYTETEIKSRVTTDMEVKKIQARVITLRKQYGVMRSVREGMEHRCYILRRLCQEAITPKE